MESYRRLQAEKWRRSIEPKDATPVVDSPISILTVDANSLDSVREFCKTSQGRRTGILFGALDDDGYSVIVDAIYECSQDPVTAEPLRDTRMPMISRINSLMCLRPVGILVTSDDTEPKLAERAADLLRVSQLEGAAARVLLMISSREPDYKVGAILLTDACLQLAKSGELTKTTTLAGKTVNGGLDGITLQRPLAVVKRTVNTIVHTGFYRLNRPNHTPTLDDARAFLLARREKAGIEKLHIQLADYHLILFIADALGELAAERVIIAIQREEDELVEDLIGLLMASSNEF